MFENELCEIFFEMFEGESVQYFDRESDFERDDGVQRVQGYILGEDYGEVFFQDREVGQFIGLQGIYLGEKFYECFQCGKIFSWKFYFIIYERIYIGEKYYKCDECGKSFSDGLNFSRY